MAPNLHPITGVKLNPILIERPALNYDEAVTVWLLKLQKTKYNHIAQMLGTNTHRVGEVLRGEKHLNARADAIDRLTH